MSEIINPEEYSLPELVKQVYRDLRELKSDYQKDKSNSEIKDKLIALDARMDNIEKRFYIIEGEKKGKYENKTSLVYWVSLIGTILGIIVTYLTMKK